MNKGIIVDLDGTLANCSHRVHFVEREKKDWTSFNAAIEKDTPHPWCREIVTTFTEKGYKIILITGRSERLREPTLRWLEKYRLPWDQLHMRPTQTDPEREPDARIKQKIYEEHVKEHCKILFVLEDRLSVVRMWREIGLTCLQCDWGDF